jgi:hypothetical protein
MKYLNVIFLTFLVFAMPATTKAQTADEIISKYVNAVGGKANFAKITSMYTENSMEVMGNQTVSKTLILNGKGAKTISEIMDQKMIQVYTDKGGWMINPMSGGSDPVDMPAEQYNIGKSQINISDAIVDYATKGYKVELLGTEKVDGVDAYKLKLTSASNLVMTYFIDPKTFYISKISMTGNMMGQDMTIENKLSDYRKTDQGIAIPYTTEVHYGDQFSIVMKIQKVEFNKPVDPVVFEKGNTTI